jgi:MFS family permease
VRSAWLTLAASFVVLAVYRTVTSSFSILVLPLQDELAAPRASVTLVFTTHMLVYAVASFACGALIGRFGPRATIAFGGVLVGLGMAAMSIAHSIATLALAFGLLCGAGVALVGLPAHFVLISERFPTRVATAMGVAAAGMGVGVLVLIPAIQWAAERLGWREAFVWAGAAATIIVAICMSYQPANAASDVAHGESATGAPTEQRSMRRRMLEVIRLGKWQAFAAANFLMGSALFSVVTHQVALLRESGWSALAAATSLGLVNVFRSAAGPLWGMLLDRSGPRFAYGLSTTVAVLGLVAIATAQAGGPFAEGLAYAFIFVFGVGSAGSLPTNASLAAALFTREQRAIAWGFIETAYASGAAFGAWIVGILFDRTGFYTAGLVLTGLQMIASYAVVVALSSAHARRAAAHG